MSIKHLLSGRINTRKTPQTEKILGQEHKQVFNHAGGVSYKIDLFKALERFLIIGSEGGTYYVKEQALTVENAQRTIAAIKADGKRAVDLIVDVSDKGRAHKNDPALFALALAASSPDAATRTRALAALPAVARIPTHLFHFVTFVKQFRGFGRGLKTALARWYNDKELKDLAFQTVKYQQRDGVANRDVLRLAHPKSNDAARNRLYRWILKAEAEAREVKDNKTGRTRNYPDISEARLPEIVEGFELAKNAESAERVVELIQKYRLPFEALPTEALTYKEVWDALIPNMGLTALLRNLGNMSKNDVLKPFSEASKQVIAKLQSTELLKKQRVHPIQILLALKVYGMGRSIKGKGTWEANRQVMAAAEEAFYAAFEYIEPTNKDYIIGCDVSGSMHMQVGDYPMSAREAAAIMAMVYLKSEPNVEIVTFDTRIVAHPKLTKHSSLQDIEKYVHTRGGGTDCSQPMQWALANRIRCDAFLIHTDDETWAGKQGHPSQIMNQYREALNPNAKIVNMAFAATDLSINDPDDFRALDVVGFDASVPGVIQEFCK